MHAVGFVGCEPTVKCFSTLQLEICEMPECNSCNNGSLLISFLELSWNTWLLMKRATLLGCQQQVVVLGSLTQGASSAIGFVHRELQWKTSQQMPCKRREMSFKVSVQASSTHVC